MRLAVLVTSTTVMDPTWTTVHLIHAAAQLGHTVRLCEPADLEITAGGRLVMRAWSLDEPIADRLELCRRITTRDLPRRFTELSTCDRLFIRVNPLGPDTLHAAMIAQEQGVMVVNDPAGIARTRSKAWLATQAGVPRPATIVTSSRASIAAFAENQRGAIVVKPASASGGRGVALVPPRRLDLLDQAVDQARSVAHGGPVVVQEYLPEAVDGEKRLFWVDGELLGAYLRRQGPGEFRHNLRQGGQPCPVPIEATDEAIAAVIGPRLLANGIRIAGLDIIGGRLVEVNTLNPGGVHWSDALGSAPLGTVATQAVRLLTGPPPALSQE